MNNEKQKLVDLILEELKISSSSSLFFAFAIVYNDGYDRAIKIAQDFDEGLKKTVEEYVRSFIGNAE